ncbi:MAG: hypothetical protein R3Y35_08985 [Clostridia bacterium]
MKVIKKLIVPILFIFIFLVLLFVFSGNISDNKTSNISSVVYAVFNCPNGELIENVYVSQYGEGVSYETDNEDDDYYLALYQEYFNSANIDKFISLGTGIYYHGLCDNLNATLSVDNISISKDPKIEYCYDVIVSLTYLDGTADDETFDINCVARLDEKDLLTSFEIESESQSYLDSIFK